MASGNSPLTVFVGNIPFEATEDDLIAHLSQVGPITTFRTVTDHETGRPRGFGFCEYANVESALSAVRNLHDVDFMGRALRVSATDGHSMQGAQGKERGRAGDDTSVAAVQQEIRSVVDQLSAEQLVDLVTSMQTFVNQQGDRAQKLMGEVPALAVALAHAMTRIKGILRQQS